MVDQRRLRILSLLSAGSDDGGTRRLCAVCAEVVGASGAGIMLMAGDVSRGSVCTTDRVSALIEQLQNDLGEGPCIDAHRRDVPVLEPDLAEPVVPRWFAFSTPVVAAGARAVFAFPLRVDAVRLGVMSLYSTRPGQLTPDQHADGLAMADVASRTVLRLQSHAAPGTVADELDKDAEFRYPVHQAAGMIAAQLDIPVDDALARLRAHSFGTNRSLDDVAAAVIAHTLRLDADDDPGDPAPPDRQR